MSTFKLISQKSNKVMLLARFFLQRIFIKFISTRQERLKKKKKPKFLYSTFCGQICHRKERERRENSTKEGRLFQPLKYGKPAFFIDFPLQNINCIAMVHTIVQHYIIIIRSNIKCSLGNVTLGLPSNYIMRYGKCHPSLNTTTTFNGTCG